LLRLAYSSIFILFTISISAQITAKVSHFTINDGLPDRTIWDITFDDNNMIWLGTDNGIARFDGHTFLPFNNNIYTKNRINGSRIWSITPQDSAHLKIAYRNNQVDELLNINDFTTRLSKAAPEGERVITPLQKPIIPTPSEIRLVHVWQDQNGYQLIAYSKDFESNFPDINQLILVSPNQIKTDYNFILNSVDKKINSIESIDFRDLLHIGTHKGYYKVEINEKNVENHLNVEQLEGTFGASMRGITEDNNGMIYITREVDHWYSYDSENRILKEIPLVNSENKDIIKGWGGASNLIHINNEIWGSICFGNQNDDCKIIVYNTQNQLFTEYPIPYRIYAMENNVNKGLWLGVRKTLSDGALHYFDFSTKEFSEPLSTKKENIFINRIPQVMIKEDNQLWIGTTNGLINLDIDNFDHKIYETIENDRLHSLGGNFILALHHLENDQLMIGSFGGLDILNILDGSIEHFDKQDGLCDNRICGIVPDENGQFWLSTFNGLSYWNKTKNTFKNFYTSDGFSDNEFNRLSHFKDSKGNLYFGGINGVNIFTKEDLLKSRKIKKPQLTQFIKYDSRDESQSEQNNNLNELTKIHLSPYDKYFELEFMLPDYHHPEKHQFSARLINFEEQKSRLPSNRLRYNKLPSGSYQLAVWGMDDLGNESELPLLIDIIVDAFFYQKIWFQLLMISLFGLVIYGLVKWRLQQQIKMEKLRTKLSSDLHDEVSGLLAGIATQSELLHYKIKDERHQTMIKNITDVSRNAMSRMSDVLWSIDARRDTNRDMFLRMKQHLMEILEPLEIRYIFKTKGIQEENKINVNDRQNIYLIFKEAINNIAKHSDATLVTVNIENRSGKLHLSVIDNGTKSKNQSSKSGQGTQNMQMRAEQLKGSLSIDQKEGYEILLILDRRI